MKTRPTKRAKVYDLAFDTPKVVQAILTGDESDRGQYSELKSHLALSPDHTNRFVVHLCELFAAIFVRSGIHVRPLATGVTIDVTTDWDLVKVKAYNDLLLLLDREFIVTPDQRILVAQALTYSNRSDQVYAIEAAFRRFLSAIKENA
jgi:hypothetical protein